MTTRFPNNTSNDQANHGVDWSQFMAQAMFEGGQAFLRTISSAAASLDEAQLQADEAQIDLRFAQAIDAAKRSQHQSRSSPVFSGTELVEEASFCHSSPEDGRQRLSLLATAVSASCS